MLTDYSVMTPELATRSMDDAIAVAEELVASAVAADDPRTYANTMAPLDRAVTVVNDAFGVGGYMGQVHPEAAVRDAGSAAEEKMDKWLAGLSFRRDLYEAVRDYSISHDADELTGERERNLERWIRSFRRAGQELSAEHRAEVEEVRKRIIELNVAFERNLSEWEDGIEMTRDQLDGLPDSFVERLAPGEADGTYFVSVAYPDYVPFMSEATDRDMRERLQFKYLNRAAADNLPLLNEAVGLRWEMARKLGYETFADYAMELKMADPQAVSDFYRGIVPGLVDKGRRELAILQQMLEEDRPGESLQAWDWVYYDTKQRKRDYGVDDNEVADYFPLDQVVQGMFDICGEVFGITFRQIEAPVWHPDVKVYAISDRASDGLLGHYYADLHPRAGKYSHAACWRLRPGVATADGYRTAIAAVAANFTKPTANSPSLLKHDEATTLFHEFGHVLHNVLTEVELPGMSGTQTERDFVEAPSQIMENWMWEPEVLRRFARHHRTGEPIPDELVDKMIAARDQNVALKTLRQVFFGHYDLELHGGDGPTDADTAYGRHVHLTLVPPHPDTHLGAGFGHMMSDGYVAGYYGYLWSKVYGDDMFSVFEDEGVLNPDTGMRYRKAILAKGGTEDGLDLLRGFLGREPSSDAFMRKIGLG